MIFSFFLEPSQLSLPSHDVGSSSLVCLLQDQPTCGVSNQHNILYCASKLDIILSIRDSMVFRCTKTRNLHSRLIVNVTIWPDTNCGIKQTPI